MTYPTKKLGEICNFKNGRSFKKTEWSEKGLPIIRIQNIKDYSLPSNYFNGEYDKAIEINNGDLLYSWSGTIGASFGPHIWSNNLGVLNQHIFKVSMLDNILIDKIFLFYMLLEITKDIESHAHGAGGLVHITKSKLQQFSIPLPLLSTQKLIVQKLDSSFEKIDKSIELTKKNLENLEELDKSILDDIFSSSAFEEVDLLNIASFNNKGILPNSDEVYNYIGLEHIESNTGKLINFSQTEGSNIKSNKVSFEKGMVLYGKLRPYLNKVLVANFSGISTTEILPINCGDKLLNSYLAYYLRTNYFVNLANSNISGARMPRVTTTFLKTIKIPLSDLEKQKEIVLYLDEVFEKNKILKEKYGKKLKDLEEMKQSILKEAFEGRLVKE